MSEHHCGTYSYNCRDSKGHDCGCVYDYADKFVDLWRIKSGSLSSNLFSKFYLYFLYVAHFDVCVYFMHLGVFQIFFILYKIVNGILSEILTRIMYRVPEGYK